MRVQICWMVVGGIKKRSSFPAELNLRLGRGTLLCLFSYQALGSGSSPASKRPIALNPPARSLSPADVLAHPRLPPLHLFWLSFTDSFLWLPPSDFPYLHSLSPPLSGLFSGLPVVQRGVGSGQGLQVAIVTLCVVDVISIDGVWRGQAVLAQGLFTVYPKLKPFTEWVCASACVCVCVTSRLYFYLMVR